VIALLLALGSALAVAAGFVLQQHAAAEAPARPGGVVALVAGLVRRPIWLAGILALVAGELLNALALASGDLTLTEPAFATMLLFALPLSALWQRRRLGRWEWVGAIVLSAGVAGFVLSADPGGGRPLQAGVQAWAGAGAAVVAVTAVSLAAARRVPPAAAATLVGGAAGILFGVQDALTRLSLLILTGGPVRLLAAWSGYVLVVVAVVAISLAQRAFQLAPLPASLPAMTIGEPLAGIGLGVGLYAERVALGGGALAWEALSLAGMVCGLWLIGRSPVVQGPARRVERGWKKA
jgi:drug/metabolite transporter (DMT)-like permease